MAIKTDTTLEGLKYNLDNRDRVAADAALKTFTDAVTTLIGVGYIKSGSSQYSGASSGQAFVTGSGELGTNATRDDYLVLAVRK